MRLITLLKPRNQGKLDSHRWFYSVVRQMIRRVGSLIPWVFLWIPCQTLFSTYALRNFDDVSWGTKDLAGARPAWRTRAPVALLLPAWMLTNAAAAWLSVSHWQAAIGALLSAFILLWLCMCIFPFWRAR